MIYRVMTDSQCCTAEINTAWESNNPPIKICISCGGEKRGKALSDTNLFQRCSQKMTLAGSWRGRSPAQRRTRLDALQDLFKHEPRQR